MDKVLFLSSKDTVIVKGEGESTSVLFNGVNKIFGSETAEEKIEFANQFKRSLYKSFLSNHFENLIVLSGAGTSVESGGKTMLDLWNAVEADLGVLKLETLCKATGYIKNDVDFSKLTDENKDLEKLLSRANMAKEFVKIYDNKEVDIEKIVNEAQNVIHDQCKLILPTDAPHEQFLNKITSRKVKDPRVKIFNLNYDTLFEQASVKGNFTLIDGFSFSNPRTLSGRNFDYDIVIREKSRIKEEESFVPKVFHLYKPHGSVNWTYDTASSSILIDENTKSPLMIYPKDSKYENSYDQPFFEMMSRFQQNLRKDNVLLICIGFSFHDKHIVTAIKEAVSQNPSFRLIIVSRTISSNGVMDWFIDKAKSQFNILIVSETFKDFSQNYPHSKIYNDIDQELYTVADEPTTI